MMMRRFGMAVLLVCAAASVHAATTYRVTITRKDRVKIPPSIERVIVDGEKRRLTIENAEPPFTYDVLLSTDGGRTVTALNTPLKSWFDTSTTAVLTGQDLGGGRTLIGGVYFYASSAQLTGSAKASSSAPATPPLRISAEPR